MALEHTLILCKPDAVKRGLTGEIILRFERRGFKVVSLKMLDVSESLAKQHYAEHDGKPFFKDLVAFITSGPVVALVIEGSDAIEGCRSTIGATNPIKSAPGSIRGDLAATIDSNLVHGSDSAASAHREIELWFADEDPRIQEDL